MDSSFEDYNATPSIHLAKKFMTDTPNTGEEKKADA